MERDLGETVRRLVAEMDDDVEAAVVEGRHDREALRTAGFTGKIYTVSENSGGVTALGREISRSHDAVAILTDFDPEGQDLHAALRDVIPESTVRKVWRKKLGTALTRKGRRDIESINNLLD